MKNPLGGHTPDRNVHTKLRLDIIIIIITIVL